jgi:hypothetical protein
MAEVDRAFGGGRYAEIRSLAALAVQYFPASDRELPSYHA